MNRRRITLTLASAALTLVAAVAWIGPASADTTPVMPTYLTAGLAECKAQLAVATTSADRAWANECVRLAQRAVDAWVKANPTPSPTATATPTVLPTTVPPTTPPVTTPPPTTVPPTTPPAGEFPDASNTGVPDGTALTAYTGPCTITTAGTVIDAKTVTCAQLVIRASGVKVTRSSITGTADPVVAVSGGDLAISDSTISAAVNATGIGDNNWVGTRLEIFGGNRGANCDNHCTLADSWVHGNRVSGTTHASALRAGQFTTAIHNTLNCDAPADNCSADLTGYPDFAPTHDWTITGNLFVAQHQGGGGFCAYGGASGGKPFTNDPANAVNIQFRDNTFQRGLGECGGWPWSSAIADYDKTKPGFVFTGNHYDDGTPISA